MSSLEKALYAYTLGKTDQPFDIKTVPVAPIEEERPAPKVGYLVSRGEIIRLFY